MFLVLGAENSCRVLLASEAKELMTVLYCLMRKRKAKHDVMVAVQGGRSSRWSRVSVDAG
jgi:hypothetical protein